MRGRLVSQTPDVYRKRRHAIAGVVPEGLSPLVDDSPILRRAVRYARGRVLERLHFLHGALRPWHTGCTARALDPKCHLYPLAR